MTPTWHILFNEAAAYCDAHPWQAYGVMLWMVILLFAFTSHGTSESDVRKIVDERIKFHESVNHQR